MAQLDVSKLHCVWFLQSLTQSCAWRKGVVRWGRGVWCHEVQCCIFLFRISKMDGIFQGPLQSLYHLIHMILCMNGRGAWGHIGDIVFTAVRRPSREKVYEMVVFITTLYTTCVCMYLRMHVYMYMYVCKQLHAYMWKYEKQVLSPPHWDLSLLITLWGTLGPTLP